MPSLLSIGDKIPKFAHTNCSVNWLRNIAIWKYMFILNLYKIHNCHTRNTIDEKIVCFIGEMLELGTSKHVNAPEFRSTTINHFTLRWFFRCHCRRWSATEAMTLIRINGIVTLWRSSQANVERMSKSRQNADNNRRDWRWTNSTTRNVLQYFLWCTIL